MAATKSGNAGEDDGDDARATLPTTREEAMRVLGLERGDENSGDRIRAAARARAMDSHPDLARDGAAASGARFRAVMRARDLLLRDCGVGGGGGTWRVATPAERAARRASENALPRHFKSFVVATGVVLVGVGLVRTNAGERKQARSPLVRHALGLPERRTREFEE
jgi:hypothetical protein